MCVFADPPEEYKGATFTGYKRVLLVNNKFFSPATGVEYVEGSFVPKPRTEYLQVYENSDFTEIRDMTCPSGYAFKDPLVGRTSVYASIEGALARKNPCETIVKMTISHELIKGTYNWLCEIVAGKFIEKIELILVSGTQAEKEPVLLIDL